MLSSMVKEHQGRQQARKEEQERRRKEAIQASSSLTHALVDHLNVGVAQAYLNQRRLDSEAIQLEQNATNFQRQTSQWLTLVSSFTDSMKEVGHVHNWATTIEADMRTVSTALEYAYKGGPIAELLLENGAAKWQWWWSGHLKNVQADRELLRNM
ncbi:Biogenesis of lysosome-related organelles complex 1 subunit 1 [Chionoecetes opilio]|uniref:Biogenesis of lysosome-related organelles complex 1 subunit 1 n=1 Tax=Chionoecetes opilio TaxID=41210 RepID=A0A8J4XXS7_CHIOP|nr:Biogenesis of lysosome-related organelles complex 1 subunit 1 [Chionoecetes opilio]